jgi:hypothetical protein
MRVRHRVTVPHRPGSARLAGLGASEDVSVGDEYTAMTTGVPLSVVTAEASGLPPFVQTQYTKSRHVTGYWTAGGSNGTFQWVRTDPNLNYTEDDFSPLLPPPSETTATAQQQKQLYGVTQAQLAKLYDSLPPAGTDPYTLLTVQGGDRSDELWDSTHDSGQLPDSMGRYVDNAPYVPLGEYRFPPGKPFMIYREFAHNYYTVVPILPAAGFVIQFVSYAAMILGAAIAGEIEAADAAAQAGSTGSTAATSTGADTVGDLTDQQLSDAIDQYGGVFDSTSATDVGSAAGDFSSGDYTGASDIGSGDYSNLGDIGSVDLTNPTDLQSLAQDTFPDVSSDVGSSLGVTLGDVQSALKIIGTAYSTWQALGGQHPKVAQPSTDASGNQVTPNKNGTVTVRAPSGQTYTTVMKPGVPYAFPDGTIVMNNGNGTYTVVSLDGTTQTYHYPANAGGSTGVSLGGSSNALVLGGLALLGVLLIAR